MASDIHDMGARRRKDNFLRGTARDPEHLGRMTNPTGMPMDIQADRQHAPTVAGETISDRDKMDLIERHITAFEATIPPGQLSPGDKANIRSKAMLGGSSPSAVMVSVMQAAAVVKPSLQQPAVNYYSSATGGDAAAAERDLGLDRLSAAKSIMGGLGGFGGRGGYYGRGDYSGVSSASGTSSSGYLSNPGAVSMINYASTPYAATNMTHSTFTYLRDDLRQEKFSGTNILHSGQDARTNGFSPNDRKIAKAFAVLDRDDGARRVARNTQLKVFDNKLQNDAEIIRLKAERDKATGEARTKLDEQLIERGLVISKETGTRTFLDNAPTAAAREQGRVVEMAKIKKVTGVNLELQAKLGDTAILSKSSDDNIKIAQAAIGQPKALGGTALPADKPVLEIRADELLKATSTARVATAADFAAFGATPAGPQTKTASATLPPVVEGGTRQVAAAAGGEVDAPAAKTPATADNGQTKAATAATPPAVAPVQTAEVKPAAKPKAPGASMSA